MTGEIKMDCVVCEGCNKTMTLSEYSHHLCVEFKTDREICDAATPGPWESHRGTTNGILENNCAVYDPSNTNLIARTFARTHSSLDKFEGNAEFIAHFNPQKVREMLDEIERLKAIISNYCKEHSDGDPHWKQRPEIKALFDIHEDMECCGNCEHYFSDEDGQACKYKSITMGDEKCDKWDQREV